MAEPHALLRGQIGELFFQIRDPVAIVNPGWEVERLNPAGERLLGHSTDLIQGHPLGHLFAEPAEYQRSVRTLGDSLPDQPGRAADSVIARLRSRAGRTFPARIKVFRVVVDGLDRVAVLMQEEPILDLGDGERALIRQVDQMAETARMIAGQADLARVCQAFADLTKELIDADFTAVILGERGDSGSFEFTHFAYNAPRHLFPERLPRAVGLLAVAIETGSVIRLADIRGHPQGVGIPVQHPPIAALMAVPLIHEGEILGQLVASNRVGRPAFGPLDEAIARHLGTLVVAGVAAARLQANLAELETAKSEFLRLASHELRGPLTVLGGYLSMLGDGSLGVELPVRIASLLSAQVRQMGQLVDQMLETARLEDGRLQLTLETMNLAEVVGDVVGEFRGVIAPDRAIQVHSSSGPVLVTGDRLRLRAILSIIIDNALKYSPGGEPVEVLLERREGKAQVAVADRGLGIDAADLQLLFHRFSRVTNQRTRGIPGTGLGLYLARQLAILHHGEMGVESTPGAGSTFTLTLPLAT